MKAVVEYALASPLLAATKKKIMDLGADNALDFIQNIVATYGEKTLTPYVKEMINSLIRGKNEELTGVIKMVTLTPELSQVAYNFPSSPVLAQMTSSVMKQLKEANFVLAPSGDSSSTSAAGESSSSSSSDQFMHYAIMSLFGVLLYRSVSCMLKDAKGGSGEGSGDGVGEGLGDGAGEGSGGVAGSGDGAGSGGVAGSGDGAREDEDVDAGNGAGEDENADAEASRRYPQQKE